jgi:hypothetical protein
MTPLFFFNIRSPHTMDAFSSSAIGVVVVAPVSAIVFHETVLKRVEVDHLTLQLLGITTAGFWLTVHYSSFFFATAVFTTFFVPLWVCILSYRAFFHPLRNFPGPVGARLSKWWTVKQVWDSNWHWHRVQQGMQVQYGDYVRTGPREIAIFDPAAVQPLLGFKSLTTKGPFYDVMETSLHLNRDKVFHRQRRKIWDNAMKECALSSIARTRLKCALLTFRSTVRLRATCGGIHITTHYASPRS